MRTGSRHLRIVVLGYIVRGPLGGLCWHHAQYLLGLQDAGHTVCFIEDSGASPYCCYDPIRGLTDSDPTYGLEFAAKFFHRLGVDWAYHDRHSAQWHGPAAGRAVELCRSADVVLNLSLVNELEHGLDRVTLRIAVDTDPIFTQIRNLSDPSHFALTSSHNRFFTYGANLPNATAPDDGFPWAPTRQPVVLRLWPVVPPRENGAFTTVMQWDSYAEREWQGQRYGQKSASFDPFIDLPRRCSERLEVAMGSNSAPRDRLRAHGWRLCNPNEVLLTPQSFQDYVRDSKAEFSIAKHAYVVSQSGWFSDRTTAYLASGRPAVVEDTGFRRWLDVPGGVFAFRTPDEAVEAIELVSKDYIRQCRLAREVAETHFDDQTVVRELLQEIV